MGALSVSTLPAYSDFWRWPLNPRRAWTADGWDLSIAVNLSTRNLLGCTVAQGYFLSRPLPADELTPWLEQRQGS